MLMHDVESILSTYMLFGLDDSENIRDYLVDQNLTILNYKLTYVLSSRPRLKLNICKVKRYMKTNPRSET